MLCAPWTERCKGVTKADLLMSAVSSTRPIQVQLLYLSTVMCQTYDPVPALKQCLLRAPWCCCDLNSIMSMSVQHTSGPTSPQGLQASKFLSTCQHAMKNRVCGSCQQLACRSYSSLLPWALFLIAATAHVDTTPDPCTVSCGSMQL